MTRGRAAWLRGVVDLLADQAGTSLPGAAKSFRALAELPGVGEFSGPLRTVAEELSRKDDLPATSTSSKLLEARVAAGEPPPGGAAAFVELHYRALCECALRARIRDAFLEDLEGVIGVGGTHRWVVDAAWGDPDDASELSFFDREGQLDKLREPYRLAALEPVADGEPAARSSWSRSEFFGAKHETSWEALGFLLDLQVFLLAGDKEGKRAGMRVNVVVKADPSSPAFDKGGKGFFFVHAGMDRKSDIIDREMKSLEISWPFVSSTRFILRWCDAEKEQPGKDILLVESGPLAPLRFAWKGTRDTHGDWELQENLPGTNLEARFTLHFDREVPLPPRPQSQPFPRD